LSLPWIRIRKCHEGSFLPSQQPISQGSKNFKMEHEALAQREFKEYLMQDPDYRRLAELQAKVSLRHDQEPIQ
jgi:hypothetical protein